MLNNGKQHASVFKLRGVEAYTNWSMTVEDRILWLLIKRIYCAMFTVVLEHALLEELYREIETITNV